MRFAAPAGFAVLAFVGPLVGWYILRSRRPRVEVASTFLWARTDRAVGAAAGWQRFRPDRTFWLVLAALLVGAVALAQPAVPVAATVGDHTILVVDISGSMLANEDGPTRLELARRAAQRLVDRAGPGRLVSVVEAGSRARVLLSASSDPFAAARALRSVRATNGPADLADAFTLTAALQRPGTQTVTHLFTDGPLPAEAERLAPPGLVIDVVGVDRPNLAVSRLEAVATGVAASTAFVQVRNFGRLPADVRLVLDVMPSSGGQVAVVDRFVHLTARGVVDLVLPIERAGIEGGVLRARLVASPAPDALQIDDQAWAVLSGPRKVRALLAGPGNVFLAAALGAVPGVAVTTAARVPDDLSGVDLLVVDRIAAPSQARAPTLYVAPSPPPGGVTVSGVLELPALTFQDPAHGLLTDVDLSEVAIAKAQAVQAPALRPVASGPSGPLLLAGRLGSTPVVYVGFDLLHSNLPLRIAWPVLVANAVSWLAGPPAQRPATVGSEATLVVPPGVTAVEVTPPEGPSVRLDPARPRLLVDRVGAWTVTYDGPRAVLDTLPVPLPLAVNPDPREGDLARGPAERFDAALSQKPGAQGVRLFGRELLTGVLLLLVLEWAVSHGLRPVRWLRARRSAR